MLRKPEAAKVEIDVDFLGFDIPNEFVVGYGLDYARGLPPSSLHWDAGAARIRGIGNVHERDSTV